MKGESPTLNRQKQAPRGVLIEKCFENTQQTFWRTTTPK